MQNKDIKNICIKGIEIYYPENIVDVETIIDNHKKNGDDIEVEIKSFFGKKNLRIIDNNKENSLTMAIEASKKVLKSNNLKGADIDMIAFSSLFPEYLSPPSSVLIHQAIKGKSSAICYDINANCIGMSFSLIQIYMQMQSDPKLNRVLLVGCDTMSMHLQKNTPLADACLGDAACAIILEKTEEDSKLIDYKYYIDSITYTKEIMFPKCGSSHIYDVPEEERRLAFGEPDAGMELVSDYIKNILSENNLTVDDISTFCFSQFAIYYIKYLEHSLSIPDEKCIYIGDKLGYTATTSPFIALYYAIKEKKIKRGDYIFIWTVGAGIQHVFALIKY